MSGEDRFAEWTRREAAGYNRLPEPAPEAVEQMWGRIQGTVESTVGSFAATRAGDPRGNAESTEERARMLRDPAPSSASPRERSGRPARLWPIGIAAALVLGVGIGRWSAPAAERVVVAGPPVRDSVVRDTTIAPPAVVDHLARTVVFLASFREDARTGDVSPDVRDRGQDLLTATQILMDSPAAADPRMHALLEDLELVLAQIARLNQRRGAEEARIASDAMKQRDILPRLRTVVPQGAIDETVAASDAGD